MFLIGLPLVAGLDTGRFSGIQLGWTWFGLGVLLYGASSAIILWSMLVNQHFEGLVRIQNDRDHQVVMGGSYHWVRHPGYLGMVWLNVSLPLILGSRWALVPAAVCLGLTVLRTALEDRTLQRELPGYRSYTQQTPYRLFPGVW
jgi:protein-S-isoprenylcysteine O-methyltransferase Ste14